MDSKTYLGNQLKCEFDSETYFGLIADMLFFLVCTYENNGENPEPILYKHR